MAGEALTDLNLDVYDTRSGPWNPEHGEITIPDDWEFLPTGDTFVTRTVRTTGVYWVAWRPRGKGRPHRRKLGLWAPADSIAKARAAAEETAIKRAHGRDRGARQRARAEDRYRDQLAEAITDFLAFDPAHEDLALEIAQHASQHTARVGSGRVGRARALSIEERAGLAARAWIRHHYTDYYDQLGSLYGEDFLIAELEYRDLKSVANQAVDAFLAAHRA